MKTKNKMIALVEIAIVLCSVLLVALPAIAADQTMQKVSANTITTASEDDFVLGVYGNANEDDTIDMRDLTYVKLIFFGKKPETELADAKYDGEINPLDFIQIKLIIVGKEKELTVIDATDRIVTVKKPIKRIVSSHRHAVETLITLKVPIENIVGTSSSTQSQGYVLALHPEFENIPSIGNLWTPDTEAILNLNPDVVILVQYQPMGEKVDAVQKVLESAGITVLRFTCNLGAAAGLARIGREIYPEELRKLGYIFDKEKEAKEYHNWYKGYLDTIKERVENIPEEDKPKVYSESVFRPYNVLSEGFAFVENAGGKNIFATVSGNIDPEAVVERNPDIIVKRVPVAISSYHLDACDTTAIEEVREEIMSRPELQNVEAVKTGRVYVISCAVVQGGPGSGAGGAFVQDLYMAKWFHPELFKDLDPKAMHQEYLTMFQGLDIDLDKEGVFVYPEPS
jgi:iron complex transport system substrate-binding protein